MSATRDPCSALTGAALFARAKCAFPAIRPQPRGPMIPFWNAATR